jgi:radical SAM protein (TIGR01212 family)
VPKPAFWNNNKRYYDLKSYWKNLFGVPVHKLIIDAGFTCPNRDGKVARGGCTYCDGRGSALRQAGPLPSVGEQISRGREFYNRRSQTKKFIAYFQTFTNTYAPVEKLRALYDEALQGEDIIGLSIGTRPDCVPDETVALVRSYAEGHHVWLELGLQSIHDQTLLKTNRGHDAATFRDAILRAAGAPLLICVHIIVGLPGETKEMILKTARSVAAMPVQGIKIHSLLALNGTPVGNSFLRGELELISQSRYVDTVCDILEILPPEMVIQRLTADGYRDIFLAPAWAANKLAVINAINSEMERRDSWQGKHFT